MFIICILAKNLTMRLEQILSEFNDIKVIDASINHKEYIALDLSAETTNHLTLNLTNAKMFEEFIEIYLEKNFAKVAYGGYLEKRNLYKRSQVFNSGNIPERNIHLGLDLWIKAGTTVLAALDGEIHSFKNNDAFGDYGPTIILKHQVKEIEFYTLYGHLSLESLDNLHVGQKVQKGEVIAQLGQAPINGDYAPHLHFQIIKDLEEKLGDYPGVCSTDDLAFYKINCPNPNILLKIY